MVQWLKLHAPNAGGPDSILGQETGSHMPKPRVGMLRINLLCTATRARGLRLQLRLGEPNKEIFLYIT